MSLNPPRPELPQTPEPPQPPLPSTPAPAPRAHHPEHLSTDDTLPPPSRDIIPMSPSAAPRRSRSVAPPAHAQDHNVPEVPNAALGDEANTQGSSRLPQPEHRDTESAAQREHVGDGAAEHTAPSVEHHVGAMAIGDATASTVQRAERGSQGPVTPDAPLPHDERSAADETLGQDRMERVLEAFAPFTKTHQHVDEAGVVTEVSSRQSLLRSMPPLVATAQAAGLHAREVESIVTGALYNLPPKHASMTEAEDVLPYIEKAIKSFVPTANEPPVDSDYIRMRVTSLATTSEHLTVNMMALDSFASARALGLTTEESMEIIEGYLGTTTPGYQARRMSVFRDSLAQLEGAGVEPETAKVIFKALENAPDTVRTDAYKDLPWSTMFASQSHRQSPAEYLREVRSRLEGGEAIQNILYETDEHGLIRPEVTQPAVRVTPERRDAYFPQQEGPLHNATLPYRTERSFGDGMQELEHLVHAQREHGEIVSAATWVHDPRSNTWYSTGGRTEESPVGIRYHDAPDYDLSPLVATPYVVNVHPKGLFPYSMPSTAALPTADNLRAMAQLIGDAQQPIAPRAFIVHGTGVAEFTLPPDPAAIHAIADMYDREIEPLLGRKSARSIFAGLGIHDEGPVAASQYVVDYVNGQLPEGFRIFNYPPGTNLEDILRRRR